MKEKLDSILREAQQIYYQIKNSDELENFHESNILKLDSSKIQNNLNWIQCLTLNESLEYTIKWYEEFKEKDNMFNFSIQQIENYLVKANLLNAGWIQEYNV